MDQADVDEMQRKIDELGRLLRLRQEFIDEYSAHPWRNRHRLATIDQMRRDWLQLADEYFPEGQQPSGQA